LTQAIKYQAQRFIESNRRQKRKDLAAAAVAEQEEFDGLSF
jgi:hypothetical protein